MTKELLQLGHELGFDGQKDDIYALRDWLREEHEIHVEVGSIWDEHNNRVESYFYTLTSPICIYYSEPITCGGGSSHPGMLQQGVWEGLKLLKNFKEQQHIKKSDDELVVAYLKGYGDKNNRSAKCPYTTNIETFAYLQGRQGDYIEEGLTDDDIVFIVRNHVLDEEQEQLRLK